MTIVEAARGVTGGVDTHLDVHVAAALDPLGALLGSEPFATDSAGYKALLGWLESFGSVTKVGVEGTGSYGAGLARFLRRADVEVIEVDRPNRAERRRRASPIPSTPLRRLGLRSVVGPGAAPNPATVRSRPSGSWSWPSAQPRGARMKALVQMRHLGFTAPDQRRGRLNGLSVAALADRGGGLRPARSADPVLAGNKAVAVLTGPSDPGARRRDRRARRGASRLLARTAPEPSPASGSVTTRPPPSWSAPATIPSASTQKRPGLICAERPDPGIFGQDLGPLSTPQRRQPPSQLCALAHRHYPTGVGPRHQGLLRAPSQRGTNET